MARPADRNVRNHVIARVRYFSGTSISDIWNCYLDRDLGIDPGDFVELCEDLERAFQIDLRPFFEEGQPERHWWIFWTHKVARDVSVKELASHIDRHISSHA